MLNRYQGVIPGGYSIAEVYTLARFYPVAGELNLARVGVNVANSGGATTFDVRKNGVTVYASSGDRISILSGARAGLQDTLAVAVADGDEIQIVLMTWPVGGLTGPAFVEVGVEDGLNAGGTDEPLPLDDFVTAYYNGVLARDPSGAELASDVAALDSACIAATFLTQATARIEALFGAIGSVTDTVFVQRVYRAYFNREADTAGQAFWVAALGGGTTRAAMRADFISHQSYVNRVALYCRAQLPTADARLILGQPPATYVASVVTGSVVTPVDVIVYDTAVLAHGASEDILLSMGGAFWRIMGVEGTFALRVRGYYRAAQRTADAGRAVGTDPTGEHGCWLDFNLLSTNLFWDASPPCDGANLDDPTGPNQAKAILTIQNLSGASRSVRLILHRRLL